MNTPLLPNECFIKCLFVYIECICCLMSTFTFAFPNLYNLLFTFQDPGYAHPVAAPPVMTPSDRESQLLADSRFGSKPEPASSAQEHSQSSANISSQSQHSSGASASQSYKQESDVSSQLSNVLSSGLNLDALLQDERLKNVLFAGISKATAKLEQSLQGGQASSSADTNSENVAFLSDAGKSSSSLFPSATQKPKSILKQTEDKDSSSKATISNLSTLEHTLQLLRGKPEAQQQSTSTANVYGASVKTNELKGALKQLASYREPDAGLSLLENYGGGDEEEEVYSKDARQKEVRQLPSNAEAVKRETDYGDVQDKMFEQWRQSINKSSSGGSGKNTKKEKEFSTLMNRDQDKTRVEVDGSGAASKDENIDSTVQNILHSIGFNFDLSKRMQELAKKKKREQDSVQTGIVDEKASFQDESNSGIDSLIKEARASMGGRKQSPEPKAKLDSHRGRDSPDRKSESPFEDYHRSSSRSYRAKSPSKSVYDSYDKGSYKPSRISEQDTDPISDFEDIESPERFHDYDKDADMNDIHSSKKQMDDDVYSYDEGQTTTLSDRFDNIKRDSQYEDADKLQEYYDNLYKKEKVRRGTLRRSSRSSSSERFVEKISRRPEFHQDSPHSRRVYDDIKSPDDSRSRVTERYQQNYKDEYFYPDEQEPVSSAAVPLLSSRRREGSHMSSERQSATSASNISKFPGVENIRVVSRVQDDADSSETRRIILPARKVVSRSPSPRRSVSPVNLRIQKRAMSPYDTSNRDVYHNEKRYSGDYYDDVVPPSSKIKRIHSPAEQNLPPREASGTQYRSPQSHRDQSPYDSNQIRIQYRSHSRSPIRSDSGRHMRMIPGLESSQWMSPERQRALTPEHHKSFSPKIERRRSRTPDRKRSRTPNRRRSRTPDRRRSRTPDRRRSKSPDHQRKGRTPEKRGSRVPDKRRSVTPDRHIARGLGRRRSVSPERRIPRGLEKRRSRTPEKRKSYTPDRRYGLAEYERRKFVDGSKKMSRSPNRSKTSVRSKSPYKQGSKRRSSRSPVRSQSPNKVGKNRRSPRRHSRSPKRRRSRSPGKRSSQSPGRRQSPIRHSERRKDREPRDVRLSLDEDKKTSERNQSRINSTKTDVYKIDNRGEKPKEPKVDMSKLSTADRKAYLQKMLEERGMQGHNVDHAKIGIISVIEKLSDISVEKRKEILIKVSID